MKRDLRIHFEVLEELAWDLNRFKEAIQAMQEAVHDLDALLATGEGEAFSALRAGKVKIEGHLKEYYEQVDAIYQLVAGYNNDMKSYIRPIRHDTMVRVDRDDIWFNLNSMQSSVNSLSTIKTSVPPSHNPYMITPIASDILQQYERKHNINQVQAIETAVSDLHRSLDEYLEMMRHLYGTRIVPFENTDDEYKRKTKELYHKYTSSAERRTDIWNGVVSGIQSFGDGFFDSFKNLAKGIFSTFEFIASDVVVIIGSVIGTPTPDWAEAAVNETLGTFLIGLKDPLLIAESMAQGVSDTYEEEGIVYITGYIAGELTQVYLTKKAAEKLQGKGTVTDWSSQSDKMSTHSDVHGRSGDLSTTSIPNSSMDLYNSKGDLLQRRFYDANGNMIKDIDFLHNNTGAFEHTFPHSHYWADIDGKLIRFDSLEEWLKALGGN